MFAWDGPNTSYDLPEETDVDMVVEEESPLPQTPEPTPAPSRKRRRPSEGHPTKRVPRRRQPPPQRDYGMTARQQRDLIEVNESLLNVATKQKLKNIVRKEENIRLRAENSKLANLIRENESRRTTRSQRQGFRLLRNRR